MAFGIVAAFLALTVWTSNRHSAFDRAVWSGDLGDLKVALGQEINPNRLVAKPTFENAVRNLFGFQTVNRSHPLVVAIQNERLDVAAELIRAGVDVNGHDGTGYTALTYAAHSGNVKLSEFLLDHGADPNLRWKDGTPIHTEAKPNILDLFKKRGISLKP